MVLLAASIAALTVGVLKGRQVEPAGCAVPGHRSVAGHSELRAEANPSREQGAREGSSDSLILSRPAPFMRFRLLVRAFVLLARPSPHTISPVPARREVCRTHKAGAPFRPAWMGRSWLFWPSAGLLLSDVAEGARLVYADLPAPSSISLHHAFRVGCSMGGRLRCLIRHAYMRSLTVLL